MRRSSDFSAEAQSSRTETERSHADAERRQAEADFEIASKALGQIIELGYGGYSSLPKSVSSDSGLTLLAQTRKHLLDLFARRPGHEMIHERLKSVEYQLSDTLIQKGRWDEARSVLEGSLASLSRDFRVGPRAHLAHFWECQFLHRLAEVAERQGMIQETESHLRRAILAGDEWVRLAPSAESITVLCDFRRSLAGLLARQGNFARAGSLIAANRRMLDSVSGEFLDEGIAALRLLARLDLDSRAVDASPASNSAKRSDRSENPDPLHRLASTEADHLSPESWAGLVAEALRQSEGFDSARLDEVICASAFGTQLAWVTTQLRHRGKLDEARRTADRLVAFERLIVSRHPNLSWAHLALANAYEQVNKNAWWTHDRAAIERSLRLAIEETQRALVLDPQNEVARLAMDRRQSKLQGLLHPQRTGGP